MLTPEQKILRSKGIGASEIGAIMGCDPFRSAADVWLEKTGKLTDWDGNEATERGNLLEPALIGFAEQTLGVELERNVSLVHPKYPVLMATLDAFARPQNISIEAKSSIKVEEWGEIGTDEVPKRVILQCQAQMGVIGPAARYVMIPFLQPRYLVFTIYQVERDAELIEMVQEAALTWWDKHVVRDTRPDNFKPSMEILKRIRRDPSSVAEIESKIVDQFEADNEKAKAAIKVMENSKGLLIAALGECEAGNYCGGIVTYLEQDRAGYFVQPTKFRKLAIKTGRKLLPKR